MVAPPAGTLDDSYESLLITDFSGGWVSSKGPLLLGTNEAADCLNVIPFQGRLQYRGGWALYAALTAVADGFYEFYDTNGNHHYCVWLAGTLYDVISGSLVVVDAASYTTGQQIGHVYDQGVLYWSTQTVPLRRWNPVTAVVGAVPSSGAPGTVNPPSSAFLFWYAGSIVALSPTISGVYQSNVFCWCNPLDVTTWLGTSSQAVGPRNSAATLNFGQTMGVANIGVSPFRSMIVMRSDNGIYGYSGALGSQTEFVVNCPAGNQDTYCVQYMPNVGKLGVLLFLGTDTQFWATNGVTAEPVSMPIQNTLAPAVINAKRTSLGTRFYSGFSQRWQYYFCTVGTTQYAYKWDIGAWFRMSGWPVGFYLTTPDNDGVPAMFCASATPGQLYFAKIGLDGLGDNGAAPAMFWKSGVLHCGNPAQHKEFDWVDLFPLATGAAFTVTATSMMDAQAKHQISDTLLFTSPSTTSGASVFILGSSLLGGPDVLGTGTVSSPGTADPSWNRGHFSVTPDVSNDPFLHGMTGLKEKLRGNGIQVTIAYASGPVGFELAGYGLQYLKRGFRRGSANPYEVQGGVTPTFDPYF